MDPDHLPKCALESSQRIAPHGRHKSWYVVVLAWFSEHGLDIDKTPSPPFGSPYTRLSHEERNQVMRLDLLQRYVHET